MSTPGIGSASACCAVPWACEIRQHQWNRYARFGLRSVFITSTIAPASRRAVMKAFALERNGSARSSMLLLAMAFTLAHDTQNIPLFVGMTASPSYELRLTQ